MTCAGRRRHRRRLAGHAWFCFACLLLVPAWVRAETAPPPKPEPNRSGRPSDPLSFVEGSPDSWSVLNGEKGCYLLSAYRKGSSRLAVGRHPVLGSGLFVVGLGLSLSDMSAAEPVLVEEGRGGSTRPGRVAASMLLFVAMDATEVKRVLDELDASGMLWIVVRHAAIAHGGEKARAAIAEYRRVCGDNG